MIDKDIKEVREFGRVLRSLLKQIHIEEYDFVKRIEVAKEEIRNGRFITVQQLISELKNDK